MKRFHQTFAASARLFTASAAFTHARGDTFDLALAGGGVSGSLAFTPVATSDASFRRHAVSGVR